MLGQLSSIIFSFSTFRHLDHPSDTKSQSATLRRRAQAHVGSRDDTSNLHRHGFHRHHNRDATVRAWAPTVCRPSSSRAHSLHTFSQRSTTQICHKRIDEEVHDGPRRQHLCDTQASTGVEAAKDRGDYPMSTAMSGAAVLQRSGRRQVWAVDGCESVQGEARRTGQVHL